MSPIVGRAQTINLTNPRIESLKSQTNSMSGAIAALNTQVAVGCLPPVNSTLFLNYPALFDYATDLF